MALELRSKDEARPAVPAGDAGAAAKRRRGPTHPHFRLPAVTLRRRRRARPAPPLRGWLPWFPQPGSAVRGGGWCSDQAAAASPWPEPGALAWGGPRRPATPLRPPRHPPAMARGAGEAAAEGELVRSGCVGRRRRRRRLPQPGPGPRNAPVCLRGWDKAWSSLRLCRAGEAVARRGRRTVSSVSSPWGSGFCPCLSGWPVARQAKGGW